MLSRFALTTAASPRSLKSAATSIYLTEEMPLTPEVVDTYFPTLLVA